MKPTLFLLAFLAFQVSFSQYITGPELLNKAIKYHDPNGNWEQFNSQFIVTMETPNSSNRESNIQINIPHEYFQVKETRDTTQTTYTIDKTKCRTSIKDSVAGKRTPCEMAKRYKNYYTYLYGLPMKLKDPGTHISETVEKQSFKGKEYLVLEVQYDKAVGNDVWYFYFDPTTYAMEVYQFYKGHPNGKGKDTGEYILLTEEAAIQDIKMPKNRAWYYNKDDKYLGTDTLKANE